MDILKRSYSLLVIPGYLYDAHVIRMWAETAYKYKVLLITDFKCCSNIQMLKEEIEYANLQSPDDYMTNIVMTCNRFLGRKKSSIADESEDLFLPASAALAGRLRSIYKELGTHSNVQDEIVIDSLLLKDDDEILLNLCEQDLAYLEQKCLVSIYLENNHIMTASCRTLYNGSIKELKSFPIVFSVDCITKIIQSSVFEFTFCSWDSTFSQRLSDLILKESSNIKALYHQLEIRNIEMKPTTRDLEIEVWVENVQSPNWISILLCFNRRHLGINLNNVTIKQASID